MEHSHTPVPSELKNVLLEFTISVLVEQPNDLLSYAAEYFARLLRRRNDLGLSEDGVELSNEPDELQRNPKTKEEEQKIRHTLQRIPVFRTLSKQQTEALIDAMIPRRTKPKEIILKQGDEGDYFYVVEYGKFEAYLAKNDSTEELVKDYDDSGFFGEMALLYDTPQWATIKSVTSGLLWAIDKSSFQKTIYEKFYQVIRRYKTLLKSVPVLNGLSDYDVTLLCDEVEHKVYERGNVLVHKGDMCRGLYVVEDGELEISDPEEGRDEETNKGFSRNYFGAFELNVREPATVKAKTKVDIAFLESEAIQRCLGIVEN